MNSLELAKEYARSFHNEAKDEITKIEFVGAIRRAVPKPEVISMLVLPKNGVNHLGYAVIKIASVSPYKLGAKLMSFLYIHYKINLFIATNLNWEMLKFIRTGPDTFLKRACKRAKELKMMLHADGSGIEMFDFFGGSVNWVHPKSEEDIFGYLKWPYVEPRDRV